MHSFLTYFDVSPWGYALVFLGMILEGDAVLFTAAFLAEEGIFNPFVMAVVVFAGVITGDFCWYSLGRWLGSSSVRVQKWIQKIPQSLDAKLHARPLRTILISKFTYGFHHAVLLRVGASKLRRADFVRYDIIAALVWMAIVGGLGYFSGASFSLIKHYLKTAELGLLFILIIFFVVWHFIINRSRETLE